MAWPAASPGPPVMAASAAQAAGGRCSSLPASAGGLRQPQQQPLPAHQHLQHLQALRSFSRALHRCHPQQHSSLQRPSASRTKRGQWMAGPADSGQPGSKHLGASLHHSIHAESSANPTDGLAVLARHQLADRNSCLARLLVCMHRTVHSCTGMRSLACDLKRAHHTGAAITCSSCKLGSAPLPHGHGTPAAAQP
jgi:hypothetical protein